MIPEAQAESVKQRAALTSVTVCCARSVVQSRLTLCDPMDWSLPGSSVPGILQARLQE